MRTHTMTTLYRKDLRAPEDFTESRNIVCMIDRVCCVMYRCNYELLISPYNLFHPTTKTHYNPGVCSIACIGSMAGDVFIAVVCDGAV